VNDPLVIIQARTGSTRRPAKVLAEISGIPLLTWLVKRVQRATKTTGIVVATTEAPGDDAIVELCESLPVDVFRGDENDVLGRFVAAARQHEAETIVRVSADSPFIDGAIVDHVVERFRGASGSLHENISEPGWPVGTAVEVLSIELLERLDREATEMADREHVTVYAYRHREGYELAFAPPPDRWRAPNVRLCVDTEEDLEAARAIGDAISGDLSAPLERVLEAQGR
jgi:spore coat polysaccharide biosynthesis protein SpsF (cytidylyltransferase family)